MRAFQNIVFVIVLMMAPLALAEEDDILVGRSAEGKLKFETSYVQPFELPASIFAGISGCATGSLGVHANDLDDLGNDFFTLSTASDLRFILLAKDPGMEVWNDHGSSHMGVGENFFIGPPYFDTHPIWNLVTGTPGNTYSLALKLHDVNGVYSDSDPFTLSFTAQIVRHQISIARTDVQHATLSWTTNAVGWSLESAASVTAANWDVVTNVSSLVGTNFSLGISTSTGQKFFRLRQL